MHVLAERRGKINLKKNSSNSSGSRRSVSNNSGNTGRNSNGNMRGSWHGYVFEDIFDDEW